MQSVAIGLDCLSVDFKNKLQWSVYILEWEEWWGKGRKREEKKEKQKVI